MDDPSAADLDSVTADPTEPTEDAAPNIDSVAPLTTPDGGGDALSPCNDAALVGQADVTLTVAAVGDSPVGDALVITAPPDSGHAPPLCPRS